MQVQPILVVTQDAGLWQSWQLLAQSGKQPYRGVGMQDMLNWKARGHRLVIVDMALLKQLGAEEQWSTYFDGLCVLVLSAHMSDTEGQLVLAKGASGYAHSHLPMESLALVISSLESGAIWLGRSLPGWAAACYRKCSTILTNGCRWSRPTTGRKHCPAGRLKWLAWRRWGTAMRTSPKSY